MRGFLISFEALLSLLILTAFLLEFFIPFPNTFSILRFVELNDRFTASLEAGIVPNFPEYAEGMDCLSIRYRPEIHGTAVSIIPVCIR